MRIAIDLRSLQSGNISGVENYTLNLLEHMLPMDRQNNYTLFYNSWGRKAAGDFHFINSKVRATHYPNKILNAALKVGAVNLEQIIGDFDCLFMPNLNQFSIKPSARLAITVHDLSPIVTPEFYNIKRKLWHWLLNYKKAFLRADVIFAVSEYTKLDLVRLFGLPPEKIKVLYPGVDKAVFNSALEIGRLRQARNFYGLPGEYFLFLNTIEPRKNLATLIKAFELLDIPEHLVIAGKKGWKYRSVLRQIKKSKKSGKIRYIGYVSDADKPAIIKLARALVYPSFYEGFGFQPLEAFACGVPVVASSVTAIPEVAGDAALLVNPYNIDELATALKEVAENDNLRKLLAEKGLKRADEFNWDKAAKGVLEELNKL